MELVSFLIAVSVVALTWWAIKEAVVRQDLTAIISGFRSLLSALCDADVQLGEELDIIGSSKKLASLLLQERSLEGDIFSRHLTCDSQRRFTEFINDVLTSPPGEMAKLFYADLVG